MGFQVPCDERAQLRGVRTQVQRLDVHASIFIDEGQGRRLGRVVCRADGVSRFAKGADDGLSDGTCAPDDESSALVGVLLDCGHGLGYVLE